jgi:hypothetical protein
MASPYNGQLLNVYICLQNMGILGIKMQILCEGIQSNINNKN